MTRSLVSFEAYEEAFQHTAVPPAGREVAAFLSDALQKEGVRHEGPVERQGWAWEMRGDEGGVAVECIVALTDDPPMQWQIHTYARLPLRSRLLSRGKGEAEREAVLRRWCLAIDRALKGHIAVKTIRWYYQANFDRDHGATWSESP